MKNGPEEESKEEVKVEGVNDQKKINQKKINQKKMIEKMKEKALNKMNKKRGKIAKKFGIENDTNSETGTPSMLSAQDSDIPK